MPIATQRLAEALVARPSGRIDHAGATAFEGELGPLIDEVGAAQGTLVLDLAGIDYISSVGLRVLMVASRRIRERQAQLVLTRLQPVVAEIFAISRFDKVLKVTPGLDEALAGCSAEARAAHAAAAPASGERP